MNAATADGVLGVLLVGKHAHGRVALIDAADRDLIMGRNWSVSEYRSHTGTVLSYAISGDTRPDGTRTTVLMHKLITGYALTDHINHDGLDNRRENLRPATAAQNAHNRRSRPDSSSRFKGVYWDKYFKRWVAAIRSPGSKRRNLGWFETELEAAAAYDKAARKAFGDYACLNLYGAAEPPRIPPCVSLRAIRQSQGLTMGRLAEAISERGVPVNSRTISNVELGHSGVSHELLTAWAEALRLNPQDVRQDADMRELLAGVDSEAAA